MRSFAGARERAGAMAVVLCVWGTARGIPCQGGSPTAPLCLRSPSARVSAALDSLWESGVRRTLSLYSGTGADFPFVFLPTVPPSISHRWRSPLSAACCCWFGL